MRNKKLIRRTRIRHSIRRKVQGTASRPRLSVYKSNRAIYAQLIDDQLGRTLASSTSLRKKKSQGHVNKALAREVGVSIAKQALPGVKQVVFDRGGGRYHGSIQALADAARESGLIF